MFKILMTIYEKIDFSFCIIYFIIVFCNFFVTIQSRFYVKKIDVTDFNSLSRSFLVYISENVGYIKSLNDI